MPTPKPKTVDARIDARMAAERSKKRSPTRAPTIAPAIAPRSPPRGNWPRSRLCNRAWEGLSVPTPRWLRPSASRSSTRDVIPALLGLNLDRRLRSRPARPVTSLKRSGASDASARGFSGPRPIGSVGRGGGRTRLFLASDRRRRGREVLARSSSTSSQFVQNPCDERVRAVPYRLERPPQGGSDLLTALARDEMPKNELFILCESSGHDPLQLRIDYDSWPVLVYIPRVQSAE